MSPEAQNAAIAGACGIKPAWFLMKRGLYYRPNAKGYTSDPAEAGRFSDAEANLHVNPHDEPVTKHLIAPPDFSSDLNAIHEVEEMLNDQQQAVYTLYLHQLSKRDKSDHLGRDFDAIHAKAAECLAALVRTLNLWDDTQ